MSTVLPVKADFATSKIGWFCRRGDLEIVVPEDHEEADSAAIEVARQFLGERASVEKSAQDWLTHHLALPGSNRLAVFEVLPTQNQHGASELLIYLNSDDRYLWIELGLHATINARFVPVYLLVKYR